MPPEKSDEAIERAVMRELEWDPKVGSAHIGVTASEGAIMLTGYVSTYPEKLAAVRAAEHVHGVRTIADEIEVRLPGSSEGDDEAIAEQIARQLRWNAVVPDTVAAEVRNGYVTLRGTVESGYQREEAERPIEQVRGVYGVSNQITIEPSPKPRADEIDHRVHEAISRMAELDTRSIRIATKDGTVHLQGNVHTLAASRMAEQAAASAPGVTDVKNDIVVSP